jgi:hypothetical protein
MYTALKGAAVALALVGATLATAGTANAANVGISFNVGDVAFGYQDGYWDRSHHWHHWRNQSQARSYRTSSGSQYHSWNHDRDADHGWHS